MSMMMTEADDRSCQDPERKRRQRVPALSRREREGASGSAVGGAPAHVNNVGPHAG